MTQDRPGMSDEGSVRDDEAAYERATWEAIDECKNLSPPYQPTIWIGMVRQRGAAEAARQLLANGDIQDGFRRLITAGRADLTVEWSALHPRWRRIFHAPHREAARWRLRQAGIEEFPDDDRDIGA